MGARANYQAAITATPATLSIGGGRYASNPILQVWNPNYKQHITTEDTRNMEHTTQQRVQELKQQIRVASDQLHALGIIPELTPRQQGRHEAEVTLARSEGYVKGYSKAEQELTDKRGRESRIAYIALLAGQLWGSAAVLLGMALHAL